MITVAADGSSLGNPGPSGWAWIGPDGAWDAGGWPEGTNNIGELTAVLQVLWATQAAGLADQPLHILCDSQYVINCVTRWMPGWKAKGWRKASKGPIKNVEILQQIDAALAGRTVTFEWVKGHAGHKMNEAADRYANRAAVVNQHGGEVPAGPAFGVATPRTTVTGQPVGDLA